MEWEPRCGQMVLNMKESGETTKQMEKESFGMLMEMFMKENGLMIKLMGRVNMCM